MTEIDPTAPIRLAEVGDVVAGLYQARGMVLELSDGDGTTHRFVRRGDPGSRWDSPPGVNLKVSELRDRTTGLVTAYVLTRPDGVSYVARDIFAGATPEVVPCGLGFGAIPECREPLVRDPEGQPREPLLAGTRVPSTYRPGTGAWRITETVDRNNNQILYTYGTYGSSLQVRLASVAHNREGELVRLGYDDAANLDTLRTFPNGALDPYTGSSSSSWSRTVDYSLVATDAVGLEHQLVSVTENAEAPAERRTTSYAYDARGLLSGITDPRSNRTSLSYGPDGDRPQLRSISDRAGKSWEWDYRIDDQTGQHVTVASTPLANQTQYWMSNRGRISETDRRIAGGNLVEIIDAGNDAGAVRTRLTWSANRVTSLTNGAGATERYRYNALGLITAVTLPSPNTGLPPADLPLAVDGQIENALTYAFHYLPYRDCDEAQAPVSADISAEGFCSSVAEMTRSATTVNVPDQLRITDFAYDAGGNIDRSVQRGTPALASAPSLAPLAGDRATTFDYHGGSGGLLAWVDGPRTDVADRTTYGTADPAGFGYHRSGQPLVITDAAGKTKRFAYTPYGRQAVVVDRDGHRSELRYDGYDRLVRRADAKGQVTTSRYDANDNKVAETTPRGNATVSVEDFTTTMAYDPMDREVERLEPGPVPGSPTRRTVTAYNDDGTRRQLTRPNGQLIDFTYWPNQSLRSESAQVTATQRALTEHYHDLAGRERLTVRPAVNAAGASPSTEQLFTPQGNVAERRETSSSGQRDRITTWRFNAHGDALQELGSRTVAGLRAETRYTYDTFAQPTLQQRRRADGGWIPSRIEYDLAGNKVVTTQATGNGVELAARYRYDALDRLSAQVTDPAEPAHEVHYAYEGEGQQTGRTDRRQTAGDMAAACGDPGVTCQDLRSTISVYNPDGTTRSQVSRDLTTGEILAECSFATGSPDPASGYDPDGHRLVMRTLTGAGAETCAGGTLQRAQTSTWNHQGWMEGTSQSVRSPSSGAMVTRDQSFAYDPIGTRTSATLRDPGTGQSYTMSYTVSAAGWMERATDWRGRVTTRSYFDSGARRSEALGGVATGTYGYHPSGEVASLSWSRTAGSSVVRSHSGVTYDVGGMRTAEVVQLLRTNGAVDTGAASFGYDVLDRLTSWISPFRYSTDVSAQPTTTYSLDDAGNITREVETAGGLTRSDATSTYTNNRLGSRRTETPDPAGGPTAVVIEAFTFNTLGEETNRTVTAPDATTTRATTNNPLGHTSRVVDAKNGTETTRVDYVYDSQDRLVSRIERAPSRPDVARVQFYWSETTVLAEEADGAGTTTLRYAVDTDFQALANQGSTNWAWLLRDIQRNIGTLLGDDGAVVEQKSYTPL